MKPYICKQCGTPMKNPYKCEYCDTVYQNDYNNCLDFEILQTEQKIRDLQSQIIVDRLGLSHNMRYQALDFVPRDDVKDTICNIPKAPPTHTQNSRFNCFKNIIAKIRGKDSEKRNNDM